MVEVLVAGAFITAGIAWAARRQDGGFPNHRTVRLASGSETSIDLPCPWCNAATSEEDDRCPSCGQRFG